MTANFKLYAWVTAFLIAISVGAWMAHATGKAQLQAAQNAAQRAESEAKGLRTQLEAERLAGAAERRHKAIVAQQTKENREHLDQALSANPAWRDEPVPAAVVDSLRAAARRANAAPAE